MEWHNKLLQYLVIILYSMFNFEILWTKSYFRSKHSKRYQNIVQIVIALELSALVECHKNENPNSVALKIRTTNFMNDKFI